MRRYWIYGLASAALLSCVQEPTVPRLDDRITVTLAVSRTTMRVGEPDTLRVTVANNLEQNVILSFSNVCRVYFTVRNQAGDIVAPRDGRAQCVPQRSTLSIPVNGRQVFTSIWTGGFDFVPLDTPAKVPPGTYFVSAQLVADGFTQIAPAFKVEVVP